MRPNKPINPRAHRSGAGGKNRYFTTGLPEAHEDMPPEEPVRRLELPDSVRLDVRDPVTSKYEGRGTVAPAPEEEPAITIDLRQEEWIDPLDTEEAVDLANVTIDLRATLRDDVPDTYYQRFGTRVPGHK